LLAPQKFENTESALSGTILRSFNTTSAVYHLTAANVQRRSAAGCLCAQLLERPQAFDTA